MQFGYGRRVSGSFSTTVSRSSGARSLCGAAGCVWVRGLHADDAAFPCAGPRSKRAVQENAAAGSVAADVSWVDTGQQGRSDIAPAWARSQNQWAVQQFTHALGQHVLD